MSKTNKGTYHIEFDTRKSPGRLHSVRIDLCEEIISDQYKKMNVDLVNHPLYSHLEAYVLANPSPKKPSRKLH